MSYTKKASGNSKRGRRLKYTPERVEKICRAIEAGETNEVAAKLGGISVSTFCEWQASKPDFSEAIKKARERFEEWQMNGILEDARKSLKTLICGQEYEEIKTEYENDKTGNPRIRKQTRVTKKIMPNPTAVIFALCNRDPEHWQNRVTNELSGKIETETKSELSLKNVPDDLLAKVIESINGK